MAEILHMEGSPYGPRQPRFRPLVGLVLTGGSEHQRLRERDPQGYLFVASSESVSMVLSPSLLAAQLCVHPGKRCKPPDRRRQPFSIAHRIVSRFTVIARSAGLFRVIELEFACLSCVELLVYWVLSHRFETPGRALLAMDLIWR